jgi:predicted nucleic acid-binding protein
VQCHFALHHRASPTKVVQCQAGIAPYGLLTVYDAAWLELAQRRALPLATLDAQLRAAGAALGIRLLGASA